MTRLSRSKLWAEFLQRLASEMEPLTPVIHQGRRLVWRQGEWLNRVDLSRHSWPDRHFPEAPPVTRISMNRLNFEPPEAMLRRFGLSRVTHPLGEPRLRLEWTVYGEELLAFASWLPLLIRGRLNPWEPIPLPPHPSHVFNGGLRRTSYAWTTTAWEVYARWRRTDVSLPFMAIPADRVKPARALTRILRLPS
ncbi:hypothetical protein [Myxococcus xanthus]|uniref:Uncharacterized protein n=1 Tax=Myxococcus xanthus TaxID=34 RepID=A0A7Y4IN23_MYXXA|nr:hypothetical protein [Myxococcus xanthus]NOJ82291.1 hypothetical protein [Myxococcus xanthus]NOJ90551.1 hypothetical protein [Myxococcus xanthus]